MAYKLSKRSLDRLIGVDERMVAVVKSAIHKSKIDFGVICGMRTSKKTTTEDTKNTDGQRS